MRRVALCAVAGLTVGVSARVAAHFGAMVVRTHSVPVGLYWRHDVAPEQLTHDAFVCLQASSPYAPTALRERIESGQLPRAWEREALVKRVAAVEAANIEYDSTVGVLVNGTALPHSLAELRDSKGVPLPAPSYPVVLREGEVWLSSDHDRGVDSRYFGAIDVRALSCIAEPVWTF